MSVAVFAGAPARADTLSDGWTFGVGCEFFGTTSAGVFTATASSGFVGGGTCSRTPTGYTQFVFSTVTGGTMHASTRNALHTGDVLIFPPLRNTDTNPAFTIQAACPLTNNDLNWIFVQWDANHRRLTDNYLLGAATYSTTSGLAVTAQYDINGNVYFVGSSHRMTGTCTNGVYASSNTNADLNGTVYFTKYSTGVFKSGAGHATMFFPQQTVTAATDFGSTTFAGIAYDSFLYSNAREVRVTSDAGGTVFTAKPYSDAATGTLDNTVTAYTDTITITGVNTPQPGMLVGTVSRVDNSLNPVGTGNIACIANVGVDVRVLCTGNSPADTSYPYTVAFTYQRAHVLGQTTGRENVGLSTGVDLPTGVFVAGGKMFVADGNNNRVLIWNSVPTTSAVSPNLVLGQPNLGTRDPNYGGAASASTLQFPYHLWSDGTKLVVADKYNNRVLVWNNVPTSNQTPADVVIGQPNMTSTGESSFGWGNATDGAKNLAAPSGVFYDGTYLYVADSDNSRVLMFLGIPASNGAAAVRVVGQTAMTNHSCSTSQSRMCIPYGVYSDGTRLYVADRNSHRVMMWDAIPVSDGANCTRVLGQTNFTNSNPAGGAARMNEPTRVYGSGTVVWVTDANNARIKFWNTIPTTPNQAPSFHLDEPNVSQNAGLEYVTDAVSDGTAFYVADGSNHRVLRWAAIPANASAVAGAVQGEPSFNMTDPNRNLNVDAKYFAQPVGVHFDGTHFFVADRLNHRVLIWNSMPKNDAQAADVVLGQPDMTSSAANNSPVGGGGPGAVSAYSLRRPACVYTIGTKLYVCDRDNHRVLVWNTIPVAHQTPADAVLGQSNFTNAGAACTAGGMDSPSRIASDGTRLFITDDPQHRVQIWTTLPTTDGQPANLVLGQPDLTTCGGANNSPAGQGGSGAVSAYSLNAPSSVWTNGARVFVADRDNNRVLAWNSMPTIDQQPADIVLGQAALTTAGSAVTPQGMNGPTDVFSDGTRLFVVEQFNHRVTIFSTLPTLSNTAANAVLGQPDLFTAGSHTGGLTVESLSLPQTLWTDGRRLFIAEPPTNRVVVSPLP